MIKAFYSFLILLSIYLLLYIGSANAQSMTNSNYILQMGNLNSFAGKPTGPDFKVSFTGGQTGANLFSGSGFVVRAGFQYIYTLVPFRFRVSSTLVDFGVVSPTVPVTRANLLTVSNGAAFGYQVTASQNHNLRVNATGQEIPATTCDSGTCTPSASSAWTSSLVYGFGYRCDNVTGTDCATGFGTSTFYKSFASSPSAATVMSSTTVSRNRIAQITYKINISNSQAAGLYTNIINYIATPTF